MSNWSKDNIIEKATDEIIEMDDEQIKNELNGEKE